MLFLVLIILVELSHLAIKLLNITSSTVDPVHGIINHTDMHCNFINLHRAGVYPLKNDSKYAFVRYYRIINAFVNNSAVFMLYVAP